MVTDDGAEDVARWMERLPRQHAPDIAVGALFEQLEYARRRTRAKVVVGLAMLAGLALWGLWPAEPEAPVHLDVRIVDATAEPPAPGIAPEAEGEEGP